MSLNNLFYLIIRATGTPELKLGFKMLQIQAELLQFCTIMPKHAKV